jgi:hypothetical protein
LKEQSFFVSKLQKEIVCCQAECLGQVQPEFLWLNQRKKSGFVSRPFGELWLRKSRRKTKNRKPKIALLEATNPVVEYDVNNSELASGIDAKITAVWTIKGMDEG